MGVGREQLSESPGELVQNPDTQAIAPEIWMSHVWVSTRVSNRVRRDAEVARALSRLGGKSRQELAVVGLGLLDPQVSGLPP